MPTRLYIQCDLDAQGLELLGGVATAFNRYHLVGITMDEMHCGALDGMHR
jgi:hypothetical protein